MHGIDTNILVRLIIQDDEAQCRKALDYIKKHKEVFITNLVLCEFTWVATACYLLKKEDLSKAIEGILKTEQFVIENADAAWTALHEYHRGKADFSDCLIGAIAKHYGCISTVTFDKKASELSYFELLR